MLKFGINITDYIGSHESFIENKLADSFTQEDIELHRIKISEIQHERLVHLIVILITMIAMFFLAILILLIDFELKPFIAIGFLIVLILFCFYVKHYFYLENHLQYWYILLDKLYEQSREVN